MNSLTFDEVLSLYLISWIDFLCQNVLNGTFVILAACFFLVISCIINLI